MSITSPHNIVFVHTTSDAVQLILESACVSALYTRKYCIVQAYATLSTFFCSCGGRWIYICCFFVLILLDLVQVVDGRCYKRMLQYKKNQKKLAYNYKVILLSSFEKSHLFEYELIDSAL